jgi:recombination protein RecA
VSTRTKRPDTTTLSDPTDNADGFLPTGSLGLNLALGGGWPRGRISEVFGPSGGGKTSLLLTAIAEAQRAGGGMAALIDADHGVNRSSAARLGIDLDRMPYHRTNELEDAFERVEELAKGGSVSLIVLDSVASLLPKVYFEGPADTGLRTDENHQFRLDVFLRVLMPLLARHGTTLLVGNQLRQKIGVYYGNPETTPWPTTVLGEYASVRVRLERTGHYKESEAVLGSETRAKVVKSRLAAPFQQVDFVLFYADGLQPEGELVRLALEKGVLYKGGGGRILDGNRVLGTVPQAIRLLKEDKELVDRLTAAVVERARA